MTGMTEVVFKLGLSKKGHPQVSQIRSVVTSSVGFFQDSHVFFFFWIFGFFKSCGFLRNQSTKKNQPKLTNCCKLFCWLKEHRFSVWHDVCFQLQQFGETSRARWCGIWNEHTELVHSKLLMLDPAQQHLIMCFDASYLKQLSIDGHRRNWSVRSQDAHKTWCRLISINRAHSAWTC